MSVGAAIVATALGALHPRTRAVERTIRCDGESAAGNVPVQGPHPPEAERFAAVATWDDRALDPQPGVAPTPCVLPVREEPEPADYPPHLMTPSASIVMGVEGKSGMNSWNGYEICMVAG